MSSSVCGPDSDVVSLLALPEDARADVGAPIAVLVDSETALLADDKMLDLRVVGIFTNACDTHTTVDEFIILNI
jgi:hypothetical protein